MTTAYLVFFKYICLITLILWKINGSLKESNENLGKCNSVSKI